MSLLTHLKIKNFFSIKNTVELNFEASDYNIENNSYRLFNLKDKNYNKVLSLYGANASGKTTFLKSVIYLANVLTNEQSEHFPPSFKNHFAHLNLKSEFEIGFILDWNNEPQQFVYKLKLKSEKYKNIGIEDEKLILIKNEKKKVLFDRSKRKILNVADNISKNIFENLSSSLSLLHEFFKFEETKTIARVYLFFKTIVAGSNINAFYTQLGTTKNDERTLGMLLEDGDKEFRTNLNEFLIVFLNSVGIDIHKIEIKNTYNSSGEAEFDTLEIFHKINKLEPLEYMLESDGTQVLLKVLLNIFMIKYSDSIFIMDELDSVIHPMIMPLIINLLIENNIQIIYSTHNIYNMKFLHKDEIFLIEKDKKHLTKILPVKDNKDIQGYENLLNMYESGLLGGIPKVDKIVTKIY